MTLKKLLKKLKKSFAGLINVIEIRPLVVFDGICFTLFKIPLTDSR